MANETLLDHVADIVSAHVGNNSVSVNDLPSLIQSVYASLAGLGEAPEPVEEKPVPAVSVRSSVKPDHIVCLEDGKKLKMLKRHLMTHYNLTPEQYRARWNLPADYPMVATDYAAKRAELAKNIGLGRKPGQSPMTQSKSVPKTSPKAASAAVRRKKLALTFADGEPG